MLSETEIVRIFREGLTLRDDIRWTPQPSNPNWVHFGAFLDSPRESTLRLTMGVNVLRPEKYKILILRGEQVLRRLDVRGSHTNPPGAIAGDWRRTTHKHRWTERFSDSEAYSPPDIETIVFSPVEHEQTFRAFCKECNIEFSGTWTDPPEHRQTALNI